MDIEDLNKTQFLLLTLLVNFVTSIAVGVLTVSLLDEQSPTITQTVNRIVERTVETVAQVPENVQVIVPSQPAPVVVTDEERRTAAVSAEAARRVSLYRSESARAPLATGTYLPKARAVVTTAQSGLPSEILIAFADGTTAPASRSKSGGGIVIYGFSDTATLPSAPSPSLVAAAEVKQGQTALGIAGDGTVVTGIVTKVEAGMVTSSVSGVPAGGSLVNLSGNIIGIANGAGAYLSAEAVTGLLSAPAS